MNIARSKIRTLLLTAAVVNGLFTLLLYIVLVSVFHRDITIKLPISLLSFNKPKVKVQKNYQVLGFAPHWNIDKLEAVDFDVLTTLAYFGVPINAEGNVEKDNAGYTTLDEAKTAQLFEKAHRHGTNVIVTLTQMDNQTILDFLDSPQAQSNAIYQINKLVADYKFDGINIDFEYLGNAGADYRDKFSRFVTHLTSSMHNQGLFSSTSVYASSMKEPKIYDIASLANDNDNIFMMAYDFSTTSSDNAIPTAPLYGHREGSYWYDISTAVEDFLTQMPANKLILGTPWYGYNLLVYQPEVKAETRPWYSWRGKPTAQTYGQIQESVTPDMPGIADFKEGWDDIGKVSWKAYLVAATNTWRMVFFDDVRSLALKYDFAKSKHLGGVGMWALGFEEGRPELWNLLEEKFGPNSQNRVITQNTHE